MSENNIIQDFLQKLAPCIERSDLDACVEEEARLAQEKGGVAVNSGLTFICFSFHFINHGLNNTFCKYVRLLLRCKYYNDKYKKKQSK